MRTARFSVINASFPELADNLAWNRRSKRTFPEFLLCRRCEDRIDPVPFFLDPVQNLRRRCDVFRLHTKFAGRKLLGSNDQGRGLGNVCAVHTGAFQFYIVASRFGIPVDAYKADPLQTFIFRKSREFRSTADNCSCVGGGTLNFKQNNFSRLHGSFRVCETEGVFLSSNISR